MKINGKVQASVEFRFGNNKTITQLPDLSNRCIYIGDIEFDNVDEIKNIVQLLTVLLHDVSETGEF